MFEKKEYGGAFYSEGLFVWQLGLLFLDPSSQTPTHMPVQPEYPLRVNEPTFDRSHLSVSIQDKLQLLLKRTEEELSTEIQGDRLKILHLGEQPRSWVQLLS